MTRKRLRDKGDGIIAVEEVAPLKLRSFYTMERTSSPYSWRLVKLVVNEDYDFVSVSTTTNVPGIVKAKLVNDIMRDMDA